MGKRGSKWRHGYVPLNIQAALMKAHGSRKGAARLLGHRTTGAVTRHVKRRRRRR